MTVRITRSVLTEVRRLAWDSLGGSVRATTVGLAALAVSVPLTAYLERRS